MMFLMGRAKKDYENEHHYYYTDRFYLTAWEDGNVTVEEEDDMTKWELWVPTKSDVKVETYGDKTRILVKIKKQRGEE